jgi:hypothetical protein
MSSFTFVPAKRSIPFFDNVMPPPTIIAVITGEPEANR